MNIYVDSKMSDHDRRMELYRGFFSSDHPARAR